MFGNKKLKKEIENIDKKIVEAFEKVSNRLSKIEEQLEPEPLFEEGEMVTFFMCGQEMEGEIIRKEYFSSDWFIRYLNKNNDAIGVRVKECDIIKDSEDDFLWDRIEELETRLNKLELKK